jgi:ribosomal protein S18 acetylase RimI-like enzyme
MDEEEYTAKDGRTIILRKPRWEDLDALMDFVSSLVREEAPINRMTEVSRSEEIEFLTKRLSSIEKSQVLQLVASVDGKIVANAEVVKLSGRESHVGKLGISVRSGYRRVGIATKMIETLLQQASREGLKIILLAVYENNLSAITLYKKLGFKEIGRTPKGVCWQGKYVDDIRMGIDIG